MLRLLRHPLPAQAEVHLLSGRILLFISPLMTLVARYTSETQHWTSVSHTLTWIITIYSFTILVLSFVSYPVARNLYFFVVGGFVFHGTDSLYNLGLLSFNSDARFGFVVFTFVTVWYLRNMGHLIVYQLALSLALVLVYFFTGNRNVDAYNFLIQYAALQMLIFVLIGSRIFNIQRLQRSEIEGMQLIEGMNEGVIQFNGKGEVVLVNNRLCQMLGYRREELIGDFAINKLIPESDREGIYRKLSDRRAGRSDRYEIRLIRKDGRIIWVQVSASPRFDSKGNNIGSVSILVDITLRKLAEMERDNYSQQLKYIHQELSVKNEELERFGEVASRELKSPLDNISRSADLMLHRTPEPDPAARTLLQDIYASTHRMRNLLDALLVYSLSSSKQMVEQEVDLMEVISEVKSGLSSHIERDQVHIYYEDLPVVKADRIQMIRLFRNLIENAIQYRGQDTPVIQISAGEHLEKNEYTFAIEDNGLGISRDEYAHIFQVFRKNPTIETDSIGMGLAICKKIVNNHGGRLWFTSNVGKGTTFHFSLPMPPRDLSAYESPYFETTPNEELA
ncbi:MAG: hypothetical protein OHK0039_21970 [Bacteroidia bacterium]